MVDTYWQKQKADKPLFPGLMWSKPENRVSAGKLLIVGGNLHGFAAPAEVYNEVLKVGVGAARVLLPDATKKMVGSILRDVEFVPSTPSGSFAQSALSDLLENASWADGVTFAGDMGRNSETAILIEKFLDKYSGQVAFTKDAADYAVQLPTAILNRENTLVVITIAQLQRLFVAAKQSQAIKFSIDLINLVQLLHEFTETYKISIITKHLDKIVVATGGEVSSSDTNLQNEDMWRVKTAAHAAVWWLQNPSKTFEALTTSLLD